jgi:hypothetical protein
MATPAAFYELRWRIAGSDGAWLTKRVEANTDHVRISGLTRGVSYEGFARAISSFGAASDWAPMDFVVEGITNEGPLNFPPVTVGNVSSRWVEGTEVTFTATDTEATINVTAGVLQVGDQQVNYGASSATVTGTAGSSRVVYLYYDDPRFQGGSRTLGTTDSSVDSMADYGRIFITGIRITFDTVGGGGVGGGGGIGGGGGGTGSSPFETLEP